VSDKKCLDLYQIYFQKEREREREREGEREVGVLCMGPLS
jgi:hypothetical protein